MSERVCIILPTTCSGNYFQKSFQELVGEVEHASETYNLEVVVVLNGSESTDEAAIRTTLDQVDIKCELQIVCKPGKNNAINVGLAYARDVGCQIVHLVDDDQVYEVGTIKKNLDTLTALKITFGVSGLVGSRFVAQEEDVFNLANWVASLAFLASQEAPKFCMGGSMCGYLADFPSMPPDESGIADDAYVCNSYFVRHYQEYKKTGLLPIVIPEGSRITIRMAQTWKEFHRQQVRIRYGVLAAYAAFPEHQDILREHFNWRFHCDNLRNVNRFTCPNLGLGLRWLAFRWLRKRANNVAERKLASGVVGIQWHAAQSSKPSFMKRGR